ncbi:filamentous hemagglutinin N-terminal domain-containing protein, partial [Burkholderia ubonensis]|uniref:two-partner secretion domain-containing protein n=1 Tax=Burkholderia ubonensis TaxID=101571 RepID=UPI000AE1A1F4
MNKNRYRLKFDGSRKMLVAVAETMRGRGKAKGEGGSVPFVSEPEEGGVPGWGCKHAMYALLMAVWQGVGGAAWAAGGVVADPRSGTQVSTTANGVPLVNIVNPDARGLSHNGFTDLNMSNPGMVLNNSLQNGTSQIGGATMLNPQLQQQAKGILLQSTGTSASSLQGTMEVFGRRADVLVANPNGISVNGMTTLNANSLTLATGQVRNQADGSIRLDVTGGQLTVGAQGLNTDGLSSVDLVARGISVQGSVGPASGGATDVQATAGLNSFDPSTRQSTVLSRNGGNAPGVAIDVTGAGAMYGSNVHLIATEAGIGVKSDGLIRSDQDVVISANGDLTLAHSIAGGATQLQAHNATLGDGVAGHGVLSQGGGFTGSFSGDVTQNNDVAAQSVLLTGNSLTANHARLLGNSQSGNPAVAVNVAQGYQINGTLAVMDVNTQQLVPGATVWFNPKTGNVEAHSASGALLSNVNIVSDAGAISNGTLAVQAGSINNQGGQLSSTGTSTYAVTGALTNAGGVSGQTLTVSQAGSVNNSLLMSSLGGNAQVNTGVLNNSGQLSAVGGNLTATLGGGASVNAGSLSGNGVSIQKSSAPTGAVSVQNTSSGVVQANAGDLNLGVDGLQNQGAFTSSNGAVNATVSGVFDNAGNVDAASGNVGINAGSLSNDAGGQVVAGQGLTVLTSGAIQNTGGTLASSGQLRLQGQRIANSQQGQIAGGTDVSLVATQDVSNVDGGVVQAGAAQSQPSSQLKIEAGSLSNSGAGSQLSGDTVQLTVSGQVVNNNQASVIGAHDLNVQAGGLSNDGRAQLSAGGKDSLGNAAVGTVEITGQNDVTNRNGGQIGANGNVRVTAGAGLQNL